MAISADGSRIALTALEGRRLQAVAGIANPDAFFGMLRQRGMTLEKLNPFPTTMTFALAAWHWLRVSLSCAPRKTR